MKHANNSQSERCNLGLPQEMQGAALGCLLSDETQSEPTASRNFSDPGHLTAFFNPPFYSSSKDFVN